MRFSLTFVPKNENLESCGLAVSRARSEARHFGFDWQFPNTDPKRLPPFPMTRARPESPSRADPEGSPGSPATAEPSALVPAARAASPTARKASLAWRLSLLPARGSTETLPKAAQKADAAETCAFLDEDAKRLRREQTDADALLRGTKKNACLSVAFASHSLTRRAFPKVEPSRAVTAYKTDAAIASWMEKRRQKEQGRMLLRVRRARRDLDWILTRRKAQIAVCRREVKNDKAERALEAKAKREELDKLAVAPPEKTRSEGAREERGRPRDANETSVADDAGKRDDRLEKKNARGSRLDSVDAPRSTRRPTAAGTTTHRRGSLAHVSRRGSVRDLAGMHFGRIASRSTTTRVVDDDTSDEERKSARAKRTSRSFSRRPVRVETKSVWVGPGQFVSMRVEMPPAALAINKNAGHHKEGQGQNNHTRVSRDDDVFGPLGTSSRSRRSSSFSRVLFGTRDARAAHPRRARRSSTKA